VLDENRQVEGVEGGMVGVMVCCPGRAVWESLLKDVSLGETPGVRAERCLLSDLLSQIC
jgi:hypothetical protein